MFTNAWNLGTISGIKIRMHWSFLILPAIVYFSTLLDGSGVLAAITSVVFVIAIFACVLLHELGHAFAARSFSIGTRDILLLPIGGVASLERIPEKPLQELWIAVAGPLVNVLIACLLYLGLQFISLSGFLTGFVYQLAFVNLLLVGFNLIPAFPMDGGRVLRSVLAMFMDYVRATKIAATIGMYCAIALATYGLIHFDLMLMLLAAFVFFAGQSEKMAVMLRHGRSPFGKSSFGNSEQSFESPFRQHPNRDFAANQQEINVPSTISTDSAMAWLSNVKAECCNVVESGRVIGRITKAQLLSLLSQGFGTMPIGRAIARK